MPFALPTPNALPAAADSYSASDLTAPAPFPEAAELAATFGANSQLETFRKDLNELRPAVLNAAAEVESKSLADLNNLDQVKRIRGYGLALASAFDVFTASFNAMSKNPDLSASGRARATDGFTATLNTELTRLAAELSANGDQILAKFPAFDLADPTADAAQLMQLSFVSFPTKTAASFASESIAALRTAVASNDGNKVLRAAQMLYHVYLPLNRRRADAPERHARAFSGVSDALADTMQIFLDTYLMTARHQMAIDFVSVAQTRFRALVDLGNQVGTDRYLFEIASAGFFDWTIRA